MRNNGKKPCQRRNYLVKKGMQSSFIIGFTSIALGGFVLHLLLTYYLIDRTLAGELYRSHLKIRATSEIAWPVLWKLGAVTALSIIGASAAIGHYLTRGVEVPLRGLVEAVRKAGHGDLTKHAASRKMPGELALAFNAAMQSLEARFRSIKRSALELEAVCDRLGNAIGKGRHPHKAEAEEALAAIAAERARLMGELRGFKV
ncbi:MAG: methyl-accepting chemotaxis protein [Deltaproteobacteria bacterium]|nr:methyl-accepting chemotaxis protein [Deltaproteobacteria bacterium]